MHYTQQYTTVTEGSEYLSPGARPLEDKSLCSIWFNPHAEIWEEGYERTAALLTEQLDHKLIAEKGNRFRFAATDAPGNYVDILCSPDSMRPFGQWHCTSHCVCNTG